jgi:drug/metabolite transporter (DMT)-like permease
MSANRARIQALGAAALFSTGGAAVKTAAFSAPQIASFRAAIAAVALLLWMRGRLKWSASVWLAGIVYACMTVLYVASTKLTTSANAIFLQSTGPLYLLLLAPYVLHERIRKADFLYLCALAVGLAICFLGTPPATTTAPNPALGNILGACCGLAWALTLVALRRIARGDADPGIAPAAVVAGCLIASAATLPFALPLPAAPPGAWALIGYLGVFQIGLAYIWVTNAVRELPAFEMSLLLLLEPVLNPVWTWMVWKEYPGGMAIAGGAVIVAATAVKSVATKGTKTV